MAALIAWTDRAQDATITVSGTELMDAANMLLPRVGRRAPSSRARIARATTETLEIELDLGASYPIDALVLAGTNARDGWTVTVSTGASVAGDQGAVTTTGGSYSAGSLPCGGTIVLYLPTARTCRYISIECDWDTGSDGFFDIKRLLAYTGLRLRGVPILSSPTVSNRGEMLTSDSQTGVLRAGVSWRTWQVVLNNLTIAQLYGAAGDAATTQDLQQLFMSAGRQSEVLLIPSTASAHMIYRTSIIGHLSGQAGIPGRARGASTTQFAQFELTEILY